MFILQSKLHDLEIIIYIWGLWVKEINDDHFNEVHDCVLKIKENHDSAITDNENVWVEVNEKFSAIKADEKLTIFLINS